MSAAFRQWRAMSHCQFVHGYALAVRLEFEAEALDERNWVVDFGSFAPVKDYLRNTFDHKLLVAFDDPDRAKFEALGRLGLADVVVVPATGCEKFAEQIFYFVKGWLVQQHGHRVRLVSVEVKEHGANSAIYMGVNA